MKINDIIKVKIPLYVGLLIIMAGAVYAERLFLEGIVITNRACDRVVAATLNSSSRLSLEWLKETNEKVALSGVTIPLVPGAQRITFDGGYTVRYRVNAPAFAIAGFYRQVLLSQGWRPVSRASANREKLAIAFAQNPLSNKTDVTYSYTPTVSRVLGVKIAEANSGAAAPAAAPTSEPSPAPAPSEPTQPPAQPYQEPAPQQPTQEQPRTSEPYQAPATNEQPARPQYQSQPNQALPDGQSQPATNEMQFSRPPQPSGDQNASQTCIVGGITMEGSCEKYGTGTPGQSNQNSQGYKGEGDRSGPGERGQGEGDRQGPSEEEKQKMDERRFKDMKRGLSQFTNGAKMMKKGLIRVRASINKCGVGLPEELVNALAQTDNLIGKINAAKTADELDEIIGDIQDVGSVMQDWGPKMGDLSRLCQMIKQAERDLKQFDRNLKRLESQDKANKKIDLGELLTEYKTAVGAQKDTLTQAKELAKTDPESALAKIEDDFYGNMDNVGNLQMQAEVVLNISRGIKDIGREINRFSSQIKSLAKKKVAVTELQELLNSLKARVEEIKNLIKGKVDPEDLIAKVEETFDARQELQDLLQEHDMINTVPQLKGSGNFNVKVDLPEAFRKSEKDSDNDEGEEGQSFNPGPTGPGGSGGRETAMPRF